MELYVYSLRWCCDLGEGGEMIISSGVISAKNMGDAALRLTTDLYEKVEWIQIYAVDTGHCGYASFNDINRVVAEHSITFDDE